MQRALPANSIKAAGTLTRVPTPHPGSSLPSGPFRRVVDDLAEKIADGTLPPGAELPSYRQLADQYAVSVSTVQRALLILRDRGLIEGRQGRATYVTQPRGGASIGGEAGASV